MLPDEYPDGTKLGEMETKILKKRISALEAENAELKAENHNLNCQLLGDVTCSDWAKEHLYEIDRLRKELASAEACLKEIEWHPHCREDQVHWPHPTLDPYDDSQWRMGHSHGHRCAAAIAKRWREGK